MIGSLKYDKSKKNIITGNFGKITKYKEKFN